MAHEAWLVDLDGTLYFPLPVKAAMAAELLTVGRGAIGALRHFRHHHERLRAEPVEGPDQYRIQLERAAQSLALETDVLATLVTEWMHDRPGRWIRLFRRRSLLEEIAAHRAAGGKTALVSDYPARRKLVALGVESLFDVVVASGEPDGPPWLKPHPAGYLRAAEALGVEPTRCLVIGDRDDADGSAARSAGMAFRLVR
jgi:HAD superfamily hydrolase (TIGR01549 family)